jgi:ribosomal protein L29
MKIAEIKTMDKNSALTKVQELKKQLFENSQKMRQGELKNYNLIKQLRRTIARILTVVNSGVLAAGTVQVKVEKEEKPKTKAKVKTEKAKEVKEKKK